ncbi:MAG: disulfide bond formation protein B [Porticoccaceae bacterium]
MPDLQKLKYCHVNLALFGFAASMTPIAFFFFQKNLGLLPCPLCVTQRIFTIGFGVIALIAALHNPAPHKQRIYSVLIALTAALGASISARQVYLQSLPADQVPACGPTLPYLMEYFPFREVLNAMFLGEGSCAEIKWQFLAKH